jgi:NAD(P)-dependent dehydrogenase (short-subunit alcohol dehydrogenase family)
MILDYEKINYGRLLEGYNALVTGGAAGVGKAIALLFARHGAAVAIADRDADTGAETEKELKYLNAGCFFVRADMGVEAEIDAMCDAVVGRFGTVRTLVNNAGIFEGGMLLETDLEPLRRMLDVNVMGTIRCTRRILPAIIAGKGGMIVNIASDYALRGCPGVSMFAATKGAVYSFTRSVAFEFSRYDIRCNCILPGYNIASHGDSYIERYGMETAEEDFLHMQPLGRRGTAEDVANAALFLGSELSRFVNGDSIEVTGGSFAQAHKQGAITDDRKMRAEN